MLEIKAGDVVTLKSGGPKMTVTDIVDSSTDGSGLKSANCVWFDSGNKPQSQVFPLHAIQSA